MGDALEIQAEVFAFQCGALRAEREFLHLHPLIATVRVGRGFYVHFLRALVLGLPDVSPPDSDDDDADRPLAFAY